MQDRAQQRFDDFLNDLAARTPTPGGGGAAAATGALACALARMVAAYSITPGEPSLRAPIESAAGKLRACDELFRALMTRDGEAYARMVSAAKAAKDNPNARAAYGESIVAALAVPMEIAAAASTALSLMDEIMPAANKRLLSDLAIAAALSDAAARAAAYLVRVNLPELDDAAKRTRLAEELRQILTHCDARRSAIEAFVAQLLK